MTRPAANEAPEAQEPDPDRATSHSGRLLVRMPKSLHAELSRAAEREGASLNAYIIGVLSASVGWRQPDGPKGDNAPPPPPRSVRGLSLALIANLVVLAVAAAIAVALLITAWQN